MSWTPRHSVVVPVDFSDSSAAAVATALELIDDPQHMHLVHSLVPLDIVSPGIAFGDLSDANREQGVREFAARFFAKHGFPEMELNITIGHPGETVIKFAEAKEADLIVISSHGYHGLKRLVLGSTAEYVIRHCHCAVLVLRHQDAD